MNKFIKILTLLFAVLTSLVSLSAEDDRMTGEKLTTIINEFSQVEAAINGNVIEFSYRDMPLVCIYDEAHDRMRIISPIKPYSEVGETEKDRMMESNFHSALDARYAVSNNTLYAAYIHPLSPLERIDVISAIHQVASLHLSYGDGYSSGLLTFGNDESSIEI